MLRAALIERLSDVTHLQLVFEVITRVAHVRGVGRQVVADQLSRLKRNNMRS